MSSTNQNKHTLNDKDVVLKYATGAICCVCDLAGKDGEGSALRINICLAQGSFFNAAHPPCFAQTLIIMTGNLSLPGLFITQKLRGAFIWEQSTQINPSRGAPGQRGGAITCVRFFDFYLTFWAEYLMRTQKRTRLAYQLDPGVDTDSYGIHWFHVVPPVSGDIKHLRREDENVTNSNYSSFTFQYFEINGNSFRSCTDPPLDGSIHLLDSALYLLIHWLLKQAKLIDSLPHQLSCSMIGHE